MTAARSLLLQRHARAKALRPPASGALLPATRERLDGFRIARDDYRARADDEADRGHRRAAAALLDALRVESRRLPCPLPRELRRDVERWEEGLFEGTDVDVEVAEHALHELSEGDALEVW